MISINGFNNDGEALAAELDVKFMDYTDAIDQILEDDCITDYLSQDELLSIVVSGADQEQTDRVLSYVQSCTSGQQNVYCAFGNSEEAAAAHDVGLSLGKYQAFLELQELDPSVTPEQIQGMTMKEIRMKIATLSESSSQEESSVPQNGQGNGSGQGNSHGSEGHSSGWGKADN